MMRHVIRDTRGQALLEFTVLMPILLILTLGVVEVGSVLLDQHVTAKMSREGANLISRDVTMDTAETALRAMATGPVKFPDEARVILSVVRKGAAVGTANNGHNVLVQRHQFGGLAGSSFLNNTGGTFTGIDHAARNPDTDTRLRVTNLPGALDLAPGAAIYIVEVYTKHTLMTPLDRLGITLPDKLYSVAFF
jgi:TadE-like protein